MEKLGHIFSKVIISIVFIFLVAGFFSCVGKKAYCDEVENNRIITELKTWNYTLGSCNYLIGKNDFYIGVGIDREIGKYMCIPDGYLDINLGYLRGVDRDENEYAYMGLSLNLGRLLSECIESISYKAGGELKMPDWLKKNILKVGFIGATEIEDFMQRWDCGVRVNIIRIEF